MSNKPRLTARSCLACGRAFQARERDALRGKGLTCSLACRSKLWGRGRGKETRMSKSVDSHPLKFDSHPYGDDLDGTKAS